MTSEVTAEPQKNLGEKDPVPTNYSLASFWKAQPSLKASEFTPISIWFSYGSNLFRQDFERKMLEYGSFLSLVRPRVAHLPIWNRGLNNESTNRGLAYSVSNGDASDVPVEGIVHDVPIGDLPAFLRFEGVLDRKYELKTDDERRYDIKKVSVALRDVEGEQDCFVLVGRCTVSDQAKRDELAKANKAKLTEYVITAMKGAMDFGIDTSPFERDLDWVEGLH